MAYSTPPGAISYHGATDQRAMPHPELRRQLGA